MVKEKLHALNLPRLISMIFFDRTPSNLSRLDYHKALLTVGGKREAGKDVLSGQVGEVFENLLLRHAGGEIFKYVVDRHAHAADAGLAAALSRLDGDDLAVVHTLMIAERARRS